MSEKEVKRVFGIIKQLACEYDLPIGISVYPITIHQKSFTLQGMRVKYNVETMDLELFRRFCPNLSLPSVIEALDKVVNIFGRNRVSSNFIIGLGGSEETVQKGIECRVERCIIPILRPDSQTHISSSSKETM